MLLIKPILLGVVLPLVVSGSVLVLAARPWRSKPAPAGGLWGGALGIGGGYLIAHVVVDGLPPWPWSPSTEAIHRLFLITLAAVFLGLVDGLCPRLIGLRWVLRALLVAAGLVFLLHVRIKNDWGPGDSAAWTAALGGAGIALWWMLDALAQRVPGVSLPLTMIVVVAGGAVVLLQCGNARLAQLDAILLAALAASLMVAWCLPGLSPARGATSVLAILFPGLLLIGSFYGEVPAASALLLAVAPAAAWLGQLRAVQELAPWQAALVRAAAAFVPVVWAIKLAFDTAPAPYT